MAHKPKLTQAIEAEIAKLVCPYSQDQATSVKAWNRGVQAGIEAANKAKATQLSGLVKEVTFKRIGAI